VKRDERQHVIDGTGRVVGSTPVTVEVSESDLEGQTDDAQLVVLTSLPGYVPEINYFAVSREKFRSAADFGDFAYNDTMQPCPQGAQSCG
jgi:hypothetical protein